MFIGNYMHSFYINAIYLFIKSNRQKRKIHFEIFRDGLSIRAFAIFTISVIRSKFC